MYHRSPTMETIKSSFEDEHLQEYLKRVACGLGVSSPVYRINLGAKNGDNFTGVVYRVVIEGKSDGEPIRVETIIKVPPTDEARRQMALVSTLFPREHVFYTEIVPVFEKFLDDKKKRFEHVPQCYLSSSVDHKEAICLEDLRSKGFVMRDRMKQMDFPHASLAFRALGRLHALSIALRDQSPQIFQSKIATLQEAFFTPDSVDNQLLIDRFEALRELVKTALAHEDPKYIKRFSEFSNDVLIQLKQSCDGNAAEPYAVLCHGDFWINNMLFKYYEDSEEPRDIYLLDFQLSRFASPATDLSYCLFCSCGQELRAKHFDDLVKIYHESLSDYLLELGSDPEKLFPFEALEDQLNKFSTYGAGMAIMVLAFFTSENDDALIASSNEDLPWLRERIHRDHFWSNTYRDTFKDLVDRNYI